VLNGRVACRLHLLTDLFVFGSPTTVLYRADLVRARSPFYEQGRLHEDTEVCFELLADTDLAFVHQVLTYRSVAPASISGSASDFLPVDLDRLLYIHRYGPRYLTAAEFEQCRSDVLQLYYRHLAQRLVRRISRGTNRALLSYQRSGLASVGLSISRSRLFMAMVREAIAAALSPVETARRFRRATVRGGTPC
jgi:hypothetical protein